MHNTIVRTTACMLIITCMSITGMYPSKRRERKEKTGSITFHHYPHTHAPHDWQFVLDEYTQIDHTPLHKRSQQTQHEWAVNIAALQAALPKNKHNDRQECETHPYESSNTQFTLLPNEYDTFHKNNQTSKQQSRKPRTLTTNNISRSRERTSHNATHNNARSPRDHSESNIHTERRQSATSARVTKRRSSGNKSPGTKSPHRSSHSISQHELTILQQAIRNNDQQGSATNSHQEPHVPQITVDTTDEGGGTSSTAPPSPQPDEAFVSPGSSQSNIEQQPQQRPRSTSALPSVHELLQGTRANTSQDIETCSHINQEPQQSTAVPQQEQTPLERITHILEGTQTNTSIETASHDTASPSVPERRQSTEERTTRTLLQRIRHTLRQSKHPISMFKKKVQRNRDNEK